MRGKPEGRSGRGVRTPSSRRCSFCADAARAPREQQREDGARWCPARASKIACMAQRRARPARAKTRIWRIPAPGLREQERVYGAALRPANASKNVYAAQPRARPARAKICVWRRLAPGQREQKRVYGAAPRPVSASKNVCIARPCTRPARAKTCIWRGSAPGQRAQARSAVDNPRCQPADRVIAGGALARRIPPFCRHVLSQSNARFLAHILGRV